jgi:hypothetical protein
MAFAQTADVVFNLSNLETNTKTVSVGEQFKAYLVVKGAVDMTGVSVDINFDNTGLELIDITEVPGDLNFAGMIDLNKEVVEIINQFVAEFNFEADDNKGFTDGWGRFSAVVYDKNGDGYTDLNEEVIPVINQFVDEFNFADPVYWTQEVLYTSEFDESVEVFDPVSKSNTGGANPGVIDDITAVLLKRPDRPDTAPFGYSGNAVVVTLTFKALAAGSYQLGLSQDGGAAPKYIDNTFQSLDDVKDLGVASPLPSITVQ